eukprot:g8107.t1
MKMSFLAAFLAAQVAVGQEENRQIAVGQEQSVSSSSEVSRSSSPEVSRSSSLSTGNNKLVLSELDRLTSPQHDSNHLPSTTSSTSSADSSSCYRFRQVPHISGPAIGLTVLGRKLFALTEDNALHSWRLGPSISVGDEQPQSRVDSRTNNHELDATLMTLGEDYLGGDDISTTSDFDVVALRGVDPDARQMTSTGDVDPTKADRLRSGRRHLFVTPFGARLVEEQRELVDVEENKRELVEEQRDVVEEQQGSEVETYDINVPDAGDLLFVQGNGDVLKFRSVLGDGGTLYALSGRDVMVSTPPQSGNVDTSSSDARPNSSNVRPNVIHLNEDPTAVSFLDGYLFVATAGKSATSGKRLFVYDVSVSPEVEDLARRAGDQLGRATLGNALSVARGACDRTLLETILYFLTFTLYDPKAGCVEEAADVVVETTSSTVPPTASIHFAVNMTQTDIEQMTSNKPLTEVEVLMKDFTVKQNLQRLAREAAAGGGGLLGTEEGTSSEESEESGGVMLSSGGQTAQTPDYAKELALESGLAVEPASAVLAALDRMDDRLNEATRNAESLVRKLRYDPANTLAEEQSGGGDRGLHYTRLHTFNPDYWREAKKQKAAARRTLRRKEQTQLLPGSSHLLKQQDTRPFPPSALLGEFHVPEFGREITCPGVV